MIYHTNPHIIPCSRCSLSCLESDTQMRPSAMFQQWALHLSCCHGYTQDCGIHPRSVCVCLCVCAPRTQQRSEEHHSQVKIDILPPTLLNFYTSSHTDEYCACRSWGLDWTRGQKLLSWKLNNKEREKKLDGCNCNLFPLQSLWGKREREREIK